MRSEIVLSAFALSCAHQPKDISKPPAAILELTSEQAKDTEVDKELRVLAQEVADCVFEKGRNFPLPQSPSPSGTEKVLTTYFRDERGLTEFYTKAYRENPIDTPNVKPPASLLRTRIKSSYSRDYTAIDDRGTDGTPDFYKVSGRGKW